MLFIGLIMFYLFSNRFIADSVMSRLETTITTIDKDKTFEMGIVLGGNIVNYDRENERHIFRNNTDRFLQAIRLMKEGKVKMILLSAGPGHMMLNDWYEAAFLKKYLIAIGIPDSLILVDSTSRNTYENAINSRKLLDEQCKNCECLLLTSAYHMKRSVACFKKAGIEVTPYATGKFTGIRRTDFEYYIVPDLDSFFHWRIIIHERIGYLAYKLAGYI